MLLGGWRYRRQRFSRRVAGQYAAMLALAVIGMAIPSLLATVGESTRPGDAVVHGSQLHQLSIGVAIILLVCYAAYIAYSVFGVRAAREDVLPISASPMEADADGHGNPPHNKVLEKETVREHQTAARGPLASLATWWRTTL